jgi:hypothetical protein
MAQIRKLALGFGILAISAAYGQPSGAIQFEVASVKPVLIVPGTPAVAGRPVGCSGGPGTSDPGQWVCNRVALSTLILKAFDLRRY